MLRGGVDEAVEREEEGLLRGREAVEGGEDGGRGGGRGVVYREDGRFGEDARAAADGVEGEDAESRVGRAPELDERAVVWDGLGLAWGGEGWGVPRRAGGMSAGVVPRAVGIRDRSLGLGTAMVVVVLYGSRVGGW